MKTSGNSNLSEFVKTDYEILSDSNTMEGALSNLKSLLQKIEKYPLAQPIITKISDQIKKEGQLNYENFEKSVNWLCSKIKELLPHVPWKKDSQAVKEIEDLLTFKVFRLDSGYVELFQFELRQMALLFVEDIKRHSLLKGWTKFYKCSDGTMNIEFVYPEFVEKATFTPSRQQDQLKKELDTSLTTLTWELKNWLCMVLLNH
ncbi:MAG: hypothetical protein QNJ27_02370 [Simkaniaceae bacterium]|nr:hypothetical protein [Simkaniaceae bacterium]